MKHWVAEMNSPRRKRRPRKIVACEQTCSVLRIHERDVQEDTLDNEEDTDRCNDDTDTRHDPVDVGVTRPSEDEQADGHEPGHVECGDQTAFRSAETVESDTGLDDVVDVPPVPCDAQDDADGDGEESKT